MRSLYDVEKPISRMLRLYYSAAAGCILRGIVSQLACINAIRHIREGLDVTSHSIIYRERKSGRRDDRIEPLELTSWELLNGSNVHPTPCDARRSCISCKSRRRRRKFLLAISHTSQ